MDIFIARQPIFDLNLRPVAYELLYRCNRTNSFPGIDGDEATSSLFSSVLNTLGISEVTGGCRAFVNFTRDSLVSGLPLLVSPDQVVVEVLEDTQVNGACIQACQDLARKGYSLALDDFVPGPNTAPLVSLASVIKIDWRAHPLDEIRRMLQSVPDDAVNLLAEKVETRQEYDQARSLGFQFFQGFFFSRPTILQRKDVPPSDWTRLQILEALHRPDLSLRDAEAIISRDATLMFKLLRYINSAAFALQAKISSLRHAVVLLGDNNVRQWLSLFILADLGRDKCPEALGTACVRAKFGQLLAERSGRRDAAPRLFLVGLLSVLDTLFGRPMNELLDALPLDPAIKQALLFGKGPWGRYLRLILSYERGLWEVVDQWTAVLRLSAEDVGASYVEALRWANMLSQLALGRGPATRPGLILKGTGRKGAVD